VKGAALLPALAMLWSLAACGGDSAVEPSDTNPLNYSVTVAGSPAEGGSVSGSGEYPRGTSVTVTATANPGYGFVRWTENDQLASNQASYTITVTRDISLVAEFAGEFTLTTSSAPENGGVTSGDGVYLDGASVTVIATANSGYLFDGWTENSSMVSDQETYEFEIAADRTLAAQFSVDPESGMWGAGNTYSNWAFPEGAYESIEWTHVPVADPPESLGEEYLIHYYAYNFAVTNPTSSTGGGYAGFQTYTAAPFPFPGTRVNYAIWGANGGKSDGWVNTDNTESGGYTIVYPYSWLIGRAYRFRLAEGPSGMDDQGKWWGLWVTDLSSNDTTFLGELRVPATLEGKDSSLLSNLTSYFGEDTHWWRSLSGSTLYVCSDFDASAAAVLDVTANGSVRPVSMTSATNSGEEAVGENGHVTYLCHVTLYTNDSFDVQHNLGFWPSAAPNIIEGG